MYVEIPVVSIVTKCYYEEWKEDTFYTMRFLNYLKFKNGAYLKKISGNIFNVYLKYSHST